MKTFAQAVLPTSLLAALLFVAQTQQTNPDLLTQLWNARWLTAKNATSFGYGVYHFRRTFELSAKPTSFIVHVTGDNRYQLFVNSRAWCGGRRTAI
jgi:alpha-L-rhamnosidase